MCSVVFIPNGNSFYFASLRDESPLRPNATSPFIYSKNGCNILSPIDSKAGGTWFGTTSTGTVIVLLNGGFKNHKVEKKYVKSRGLIVKELLAARYPIIDWCLMDMNGIEPYTLVIWFEENLIQLVWDGKNKTESKLDINNPYLWSYVSLYNVEAKANRNKQFMRWVNTKMPVTVLSLLIFFKSFKDDWNGFIINRENNIKTLSYTFIELHVGDFAKMVYYDFEKNTFYTESIAFQKKL
jgi:uncharacterized protein with NRDE domain